jgi:predicted metalloprotease
MKWEDGRRSDNIEDRRGQSPGYRAAGAAPVLLRFMPMLLRSKGGRVFLLVGVLVIFGGQFLGIDVLGLLTGAPPPGVPAQTRQVSEAERVRADFASVILANTEDTWHRIFNAMGRSYEEPTLVFFTGRVSSACGMAGAAMGPFYCPADQKLYIDLSFFDDLAQRHGAPGDFAQAYVVAHEVGHHVQTLLGISQQVHQMKQGGNQAQANALSVRQELQADCFAGLWGHSADVVSNWLDETDLEEALRAASAIGDDRLQRESGRQVVPNSFTHGSSEQRVAWFSRGFDSGAIDDCDTFSQGGS